MPPIKAGWQVCASFWCKFESVSVGNVGFNLCTMIWAVIIRA